MTGLYKRDDVLKDLHHHIIEVSFNKVNGDQRVLRCTLDPQYLPPNYNKQHLAEEHKKKENKETIAAWDLVNGGWRSFKIESVTYVQVIDTAG